MHKLIYLQDGENSQKSKRRKGAIENRALTGQTLKYCNVFRFFSFACFASNMITK